LIDDSFNQQDLLCLDTEEITLQMQKLRFIVLTMEIVLGLLVLALLLWSLKRPSQDADDENA